MKKIQILDCTLRDGGYYNTWDFDEDLVTKYLSNVAKSGIEYIELGLRNFPKKGFLGAFAYCREEYINTLDLPTGPKYGVMIDAKTIIDSTFNSSQAIDELFVPASKSKLSFVRVAAHFQEINESENIVKKLKKLGYIVGLNLMQSGGKTDEIITSKVKLISSWGVVDILYFADSLGNMDGEEVIRIIKNIRKYWLGSLGIHTHNNMGKGLDNSIIAINNNVSWIDSTITGMGRGAGNTPTENLLAYLSRTNMKYYPKSVYELAIRYFEPMQRKYGWGSNLLYFLGAQNNVHPTYIQNLLSNSHYGPNEVIGAIDYLSNLSGSNTYDGEILNTALNFSATQSNPSGSKDIIGLFNDKKILVITNAPSVKKYLKAIKLYIKRTSPVVVSINVSNYLSPDLIDYYIISHNSRILSDTDKYKNIEKPIILPKHRFTKNEISIIKEENILDYGLEIKENSFSNNEIYASIPYDITIAYLLGVLMESNVSKIEFVGLDGYSKDDIRQQEMVDLLNIYQSKNRGIDLSCLTPTSYPIEKRSIYA